MIAKPLYRKGVLSFRYPEFVKSEETKEESDSNENNDNKKTQPIDTNNYTHNTGRIYPIYSELSGIKSDRFAKKIRSILESANHSVIEIFPKDFLTRYNLMDINRTLYNLHYPVDFQTLHQAKYRLYMTRLLKMQLISQLNKSDYRTHHIQAQASQPDWSIVKDIISQLPFTLTNAQKKVIKQSIEDIHSGTVMMRLLQ